MGSKTKVLEEKESLEDKDSIDLDFHNEIGKGCSAIDNQDINGDDSFLNELGFIFPKENKINNEDKKSVNYPITQEEDKNNKKVINDTPCFGGIKINRNESKEKPE